MKPDYKNWVPKWMMCGLWTAAVILFIIFFYCVAVNPLHSRTGNLILRFILFALMLVCIYYGVWCVNAYRSFSWNGKSKLSRKIVEGVAGYVSIPDGGCCLDVGCGSGALSIAVAKRNPGALVVGVDIWGREYAFSKKLCEQNAAAEGVNNVRFQKENAIHLCFPDESFDAVTSNYVYHNILSRSGSDLVRESLRVLKKGGTFAIHDLMPYSRYGSAVLLAQTLRDEGYRQVHLIRTANGEFISKWEAKELNLRSSYLLYGIK